jgi:hypothetical protein
MTKKLSNWVCAPTEVLPHDLYLFRQGPTPKPKAQKRNRRTNMTTLN